MNWIIAGGVWIAQIYFWGLGLTLLSTPARWRRFWPAFCAPAGLALQSLVVWGGSHTQLPGTDSYAAFSLLVPLGLLLLAGWRLRLRGREAPGPLLLAVGRWWPLAVLMALSLVVQVYPFTRPPALLTSASIGSCDAADYAAGARVFKEFSRNDRSGFLGNAEAAGAFSVDNFFDFWLRLNHFSPSALIAHEASLSGRQPYELTSLFGAVLLTLNLPGVFWLARAVFRFGRAGSLGVAAIYGFSPVGYYAVYQTALGQLLAVLAVALLTWAGWEAYRGPRTWRRLAPWSGPLFIGNWLLFGGYNFFILFAYIPLLACVGVRTLLRRDWLATGRWALLISANLLLCTVLFPDRVVSIVERFVLFNKTPFGWTIPGFWPSGWYGAFADVKLAAVVGAGTTLLAVLALTATAAVLYRQARRGQWHAGLLAAGCTLPILFGYWLLLRQDRLHNDHSSYDAYKLFAVFYPGILVALCLWLRGPFQTWWARGGAAALWLAVLLVNIQSIHRFNAAVRTSPFQVGPHLAALSAIEQMRQVTSVNLTMPQVWDRLWANCFLLRKPQYFALPTYEGRTVSALRGEWDLSQRLVFVRTDDANDPLADNPGYSLVKRVDERFVEAHLDQGWYNIEHYRNDTWCWGSQQPTVHVDNPQAGSLSAKVSLLVHALHPRRLRLSAGPQLIWEGTVGEVNQTMDNLPLELPPGTTLVRFETGPPDKIPGDSREFTFCLSRFEVDVSPAQPTPAKTAESRQSPAADDGTRPAPRAD